MYTTTLCIYYSLVHIPLTAVCKCHYHMTYILIPCIYIYITTLCI